MFELLAEDSGYTERTLEPESELVTLAVEAGLPIPGPMAPGSAPPVPPKHRFASAADRVLMAPTYRTEGDHRLRCEADAKVVYTSMDQAAHAASAISGREPMKPYLGRCGHYHVARRNHG
jgi:hypothetical protein